MESATTTPLARAIAECDLNQRQVAQALDMAPSQLTRYARGVFVPRISTARRIADVLRENGVEWASLDTLWPEQVPSV